MKTIVRWLCCILLCINVSFIVYGSDLENNSSGFEKIEQDDTQKIFSEEEAVQYVRSQMKHKKMYIEVSFVIEKDEYDYDDARIATRVIDEALESTGDPFEGDFLRFGRGVSSYSYSAKELPEYFVFNVTYFNNYYTTNEEDREIELAEKELIEKLDLRNKNDFEKISIIYNWICDNVAYDYDTVDRRDSDLDYDTRSWSSYNAIIDKKATCEGFSLLLYQLLFYAGIDNRVVAGDNHAWNIVKLDNMYYQCDTTYGRAYLDGSLNKEAYLLRGNKFFSRDHILWDEFTNPDFLGKYPISYWDYGEEARENNSGKCGENVYWNISNEGVLRIYGTGDMDDFSTIDVPWFPAIDSIQSVVIEEGVTGIGSYTFSLLKVEADYSFPTSLRKVHDFAFADNKYIRSIVFPEGIESVGINSFRNCSSLEMCDLPSTLRRIEIGCFYSCSSLTELLLPEDVYYIGASAFSQCVSLEEMLIPGGVEVIEKRVFENCIGLKSVRFAQGVRIIQPNVFDRCANLEIIELPTTIESFDATLTECPNLKYFDVKDTCIKKWNNIIQSQNLDLKITEIFYLPKTLTEFNSSHTRIPCDYVFFTGNMPDFSESCYIDNICYFPEDNKTWDISSVEKYAKEWVPYSEHFHVEEIKNSVEPTSDSLGYTGDIYCSICGVLLQEGKEYSISIIDSGDCGQGIYWSIDNTYCLRISGTGSMQGMESYPWREARHKGKIRRIVVEEGITDIASFSFDGMDDVYEVKLPDSLARIQGHAFARMKKLKTILLPAHLEKIYIGAFSESGIEDIVLPDSVNFLDVMAFAGCRNLKSIVLSESILTLYENTFENCVSLENITIPKSITTMNENPFVNCINLKSITIEGNQNLYCIDGIVYNKQKREVICCAGGKEGVCYVKNGTKVVGKRAFSNCENITSVTLPDSVDEIEMEAFYRCTSLQTINIPSDVKAIRAGTFAFCHLLESIDIPKDVYIIQDRAFEACFELTEVILPEGLEVIENNAFDFCKGLKTLIIPSSVKRIGIEALSWIRNDTNIIFIGNKPIVSEHFLYNSIVNVYYPKDNTSWQGTNQVYGGERVLWKPYLSTELEEFGKCKYYGDHISDILQSRDATCTEEGYTEGIYCVVCNYLIKEQMIIPPLEHQEEEYFKEIEANCIEAGLTKGIKCSVCEKILVEPEVVPPKGHSSVVIQAIAATCTEEGLTQGSRCSVCDEVLTEQQVIPSFGHTVIDEMQVYPTCTEDGYLPGAYCEVCGEIIREREILKSKGHTPWTDYRKEPTCTENGLTEGKHCYYCGEILIPQEVIPAGHNIVVDRGYYDCEEGGFSEGSHCYRCGEVIVPQEELSPRGEHDIVWENVVETTCTEGGYSGDGRCAVCGIDYPGDETEALGHEVVYDPDKLPTCTEDGYTIGSHCNRCNLVFQPQEVLPAKGHNVVVSLGEERTCEKDGLTEGRYCTTCGEVFAVQEVIPATGHDYVVEEGREATCTEDGITAKIYCKICNEIVSEHVTIPATGHSTWTVDRIEPTCSKVGYTEEVYCHNCDEIVVKAEEIPMIPHNNIHYDAYEATCTHQGRTEGDYCTRCGYTTYEYIPAKGHTEVLTGKREAPCGGQGYSGDLRCSECGKILKLGKTIYREHQIIYLDAQDPTCTLPGYTGEPYCEICDMSLDMGEDITPLGHTEVIIPSVSPTCTMSGKTEGSHCTVCGEVVKPQETIPALGHNLAEWNLVKEKTCTEDGIEEAECTRCQTVEQRVIKAEGHLEVIDAKIEATYEDTGLTEGSHCEVCDNVLVKQKVVPTLALETEVLEDHVLKVTVPETDSVLVHGILIGTDNGIEEEVTLETPGRIRLVFEEYTDDSYLFTMADNENIVYRAFIIFLGKDGEEKVLYSKSIAG